MSIKRVEFAGKVDVGDFKQLGVTIKKDRVIFSVLIGKRAEGNLLLYGESAQKIEVVPIRQEYRKGNLASLCLYGLDTKKYLYNYEINGEVVQDPYAKVIRGRKDFGLDRSKKDFVACKLLKDPQKGEEHSKALPDNLSDLFIYKLHPRGFTKCEDSKVKHPGTFLGIKEKLPYIEKLGVNALLLMPAYDFEEIIKDGIEGNYYKKNKEQYFINYWGYKDGNYFAPKQSYAYGEDAGAELKSLIRQIHKKNMYIFMEFYFSKHIPTFMITDVLLYWKRNYGIDGFHVLGEEIPKKALISNPWLSESLLLFTDLSDSLVTDKADGEYIGEYNQGFLEKARRLLKGDYKSMECFLQKAYQGQDSFYQVNYLADQDGFTLNDCVSYNKKHNEENLEKNRDGKDENDTWNCGEEGESKKTSVKSLRFRQMKNAILMLAFSQGIPLLYAGDECGNSQKGNNNAYCQDNSIGWVNWDNKKQGKAFYNYVKKVIDFRKAHPILRKKGAFCRQDEKGVGYPEFSLHGDKAWMSGMQEDPLFLGIMYAGESQKKSVDDFIYIAYNFHWKSHNLALPKLPDKGKWHLVIDTKRANSFVEEVALEEKEIFVEARTIKVLIGR